VAAGVQQLVGFGGQPVGVVQPDQPAQLGQRLGMVLDA
jgi:hypothetical protein